MEGGANVVIEAVRSGVPVLASRIDGNRRPARRTTTTATFAVGDAAALAALMRRFVADAAFAAHLAAQCARARAALPAGASSARAVRGAGRRPAAPRRPCADARAETIGRCRFTDATAMSLDPSAECALPALPTPLRLTSFSHGGGCGCKIAPGVLSEILRSSAGGIVPPELLVGIETADDAAVYQLNDEQALIATTDFFMPIVDDPFDFGRIAATNAISDVYAMGGKPIMALALVAMPIDKLPVETDRRASSAAASRSAARPASRSPAATPSIRSSRSTAWW